MEKDSSRKRLEQARLCVITDRSLAGGRSSIRTVMDALDGGARMIQLREKRLPDEVLLPLAQEIRKLTLAAGALFIVNDIPELAAAVGADGVHVGQRDIPVAEARRIVGPDRLVGLSVENLDQARAALGTGADYLGVGPVFRTPTKGDAAPPAGLSIFREMKDAGVGIPAFAIGGVNLSNAEEILEAGAWGLAVVSAVVAAPNPMEATRAFVEILTKHPV